MQDMKYGKQVALKVNGTKKNFMKLNVNTLLPEIFSVDGEAIEPNSKSSASFPTIKQLI